MRVMRRIEFDAGHRVYRHEGKCAQMHGHRYVVEIWAVAKDLDPVGRVIDFSVLKERIGGWIDENWDHGFLVNREDAELAPIMANMDKSVAKIGWFSENPTAENIAKHLLTVCDDKLAGTGISVDRIVVWETPNCCAELVRGRDVPR